MGRLPTLDEFLAWDKLCPSNSYLTEPGFSSLYVRKGQISVTLNGVHYRCLNTLTIANVTAENPGAGVFTRFIKKLVAKRLAVYVENSLNERLQSKLITLGFIRVGGLNFLYNHTNLLEAKDVGVI